MPKRLEATAPVGGTRDKLAKHDGMLSAKGGRHKRLDDQPIDE